MRITHPAERVSLDICFTIRKTRDCAEHAYDVIYANPHGE
jgi:hypothetical protein